MLCFKVSSGPVETQGGSICPPDLRCVAYDAGCLELCVGRRFGGGHDLHVLGEDGFESLVSVDHGTEHQWLEEAETLSD